MTESGRNYTQKTIKMIFALSGNRCAFPGCQTPIVLVPPTGEPIILGEIAHIHAFGDNGPRGLPGLNNQQKNAVENLIILCPSHHTEVDALPDQYPASLLKAWKEQIERSTKNRKNESASSDFPKINLPESITSAAGFTERAAIDIPKPKDWQAFQRNCVVLFREELGDPNTQEYGRLGQNQNGVDIIGKRDRQSDYIVGIQCRLIRKPLTKEDVERDCLAALSSGIGFREIIFATTAPDDTNATNAVYAVEEELRKRGHEIVISVYGWGALQSLIALHPRAFAVFFPASISQSDPKELFFDARARDEFAEDIAERVTALARTNSFQAVPTTTDPDQHELAAEDPALHAKIDTYRDLFKVDRQFILSQQKLNELLARKDIDAKPNAKFRILTNLGAIALDLGNEADGADLFERAYRVRPIDPKAIANMGLAHLIRGQYTEAKTVAELAVNSGKCDEAICYVLQAAGRLRWEGNVEDLIPERLSGTKYADLGLLEFLKRTEATGWEQRVVDIASKYEDDRDFLRIAGQAVLSLVQKGDGDLALLSDECRRIINPSANAMLGFANECLDNLFADKHDLAAHINNAAIILRLLDRDDECEALLERGLRVLPDDIHLIRLKALNLVSQDKMDDALAVLAPSVDPENRFFYAELLSTQSIQRAVDVVRSIDMTGLSAKFRRMKLELEAGLQIEDNDFAGAETTAKDLQATEGGELAADLLIIDIQRIQGADVGHLQELLRDTAARFPNASVLERFLLASQMARSDLFSDAADILAGHVDLQRRNPPAALYLRCLASARRDGALHEALKSACDELKKEPAMLWLQAAHAWNTGDLSKALKVVEALLLAKPSDASASLLKIDILLRRNDTIGLQQELQRDIENLEYDNLADRLRIGQILDRMGFTERAAALLYRLYLENRDSPQAWKAFSTFVLEIGRPQQPDNLTVEQVGSDVAVDVEYEDKSTAFFVVEGDPTLRKSDVDAWEPTHPTISHLFGKRVGDDFVSEDGRRGTIVKLRHKYVARLHYIMEHFGQRFPQVSGFIKMDINFSTPEGLNDLIAVLKERHDWVEEMARRYEKENWSISMLSHQTGADVIDVASGLVSEGQKIKVARGNVPEREKAQSSIQQNHQAGCVMDLMTFWFAWKLNALDLVQNICGGIHLPQTTIDQLRLRREKMTKGAQEGLRSASYHNGSLQAQEIEAPVVASWIEEIDRAIKWIEEFASVQPITIDESFPLVARQLATSDTSHLFDPLTLALDTKLLLLSDDITLRSLCFEAGPEYKASALQNVFAIARAWNKVEHRRYVELVAGLIRFGENYVGVKGGDIAEALAIDFENTGKIGDMFITLTKVIGGKHADRVSHAYAVAEAILLVWLRDDLEDIRKPATGILLSAVIRDRYEDYASILRLVIAALRSEDNIIDYALAWLKGHFLWETVTGRTAA